MRSGARVWVDVSYTRTQTDNIGITRTVRRLFEELRSAAQVAGGSCEAVAFHSSGYRQVAFGSHTESTGPDAAPAGNGSLFSWITGSVARKVVPVALYVVPWRVVRPLWALISRLAFNRLSLTDPPVGFQRGDVLFMADASWNYCAWEAARKARSAGAQVVLLVYDLMPLSRPEFCFPLVPLLYGTWLSEMLACSDAVVCISNATEQELRTWASGHGMAELPPTSHFRLGSDAAKEAAGDRVRAQLARLLGGTDPCFGVVGSFEPKKNYGLLLEVFERLWSRGQKAGLVIAGRATSDSAELVQKMRHHPQQGRLLLMLNDASDAEVLCLYSSCCALLLPSLYEGFGLALVEARTRGCQVVASDLPVFRELADAGVTLVAVNSASALEAAVLAHAAGKHREHVLPMAPFTWADSARDCLTLFNELLPGSCGAVGSAAHSAHGRAASATS